MEMQTLTILISYTFIAFFIFFIILRQDLYFGIFMGGLALYSVPAAWGYYLYPEMSQVVWRMYFGVEPLNFAIIFSGLSMVSTYICFRYIYTRIVRSEISLGFKNRSTSLFLLLTLIYFCTFLIFYFFFYDKLSYHNASDEYFLHHEGYLYKSFSLYYKFTTFFLLILYAVFRNGVLKNKLKQLFLSIVFISILSVYLVISIEIGSRTDPLALVIGMIGFEAYKNAIKNSVAKIYIQTTGLINFPKLKLKSWAALIIFLIIAFYFLQFIRALRAEPPSTLDLLNDTPVFATTLLLNDFIPPFHVLIGAIAFNYVDFYSAFLSNIANSLMFLKVDYLQTFIVDQWDFGGATRTASPAMYAFTEGYVALGWAGFLYNGIVWSIGVGLWRKLSRTYDHNFNAIAMGITLTHAVTSVRSQSSYFIKDLYLFFIPALFLYSIAAGIRHVRSK